ncbi:hydrogenase nickel incorporation protein HybF [Serratia fonticola]|uniref:Hydrogenase nickel incorporation protein HybF n=1 Tax=Serratia fonticola TaxID=47917 RepID=A0A4U9T9M8_SERFO|nr:hydrogenase nickel incorporation protein HybF [Serratia fonticola]
MELIEQQARQHGAKRVTAVWLEIGALSCIEEHALRFSFASASRNTLAEGASYCWTTKRPAPGAGVAA